MGHARHIKEWIVVDRLADIILTNVKGCVFDVGIGPSTYVLAKHAEKFGVNQYTCEITERFIERFCPNGGIHDNHTIYNGYSWDLLKELNEDIAIAFLDGTHVYEQSKKECDTILTKMPAGGVIFIHDTYPSKDKHVRSDGKRCGDVYRVRQEFEKSDKVWTFTWPYHSQAQTCGLTMIMKKEEDVPFYRR